MEQLKQIERIIGENYILVARSKDDWALYMREDEKAFEVFKIRVSPPKVLFGTFYPEKERFPFSEEFGLDAWSFANFENALARYRAVSKMPEFTPTYPPIFNEQPEAGVLEG